jgi:hypothetical protein
MSVYSLKNLPILDVRKDWHENIVKGDFVFGNPNTSGRFMGYVYYKEFGKIFDE